MKAKECFGDIMQFCSSSNRCMSCECYSTCMKESLEALECANYIAMIDKHTKYMDGKLIRSDDFFIESRREFSYEALIVSDEMEKLGMIDEGYVDKYLDYARESFKVACPFIRTNKKVTVKQVANILIDIYSSSLNPKAAAVREASLIVQVLLMNKIIDYEEKTNKITWLLKD